MHDPAYTPPLTGDLPEGLRSWPLSWYLTDPAGFYTTFMFVLSFVLVTPSIVLLRRMAQATISPVTWIVNEIRRRAGDQTRKPRTVWNNPIAWREAKTKASATRASMLRYGFIAAGLIGAIVLVCLYATTKASSIPDYVDRDSYNAQFNTFTVYAQDHTPTTLSLEPPPTSHSTALRPAWPTCTTITRSWPCPRSTPRATPSAGYRWHSPTSPA